MSIHERRHIPFPCALSATAAAVHMTFFNMVRPFGPNTSSAIAQGYVVSTHNCSENMRCVQEIHGLVIGRFQPNFQHGAA